MEVKEKPLVSVLIPCFNMEKKITRCLDSLLNQTYSKLEIIFVDDGSTDGTADKIKEFATKFELSGGVCQYIYQKNRGVGAAINTGLKYVHGQYMTWPDPDDWFAADSIEKRVEFLEKHKEYGMVTSNAYMYHEYNLKKPFRKLIKRVDKSVRDENQFEQLLNYNSVFCPGCHLVRMSAFDDAIPMREIYDKINAQNFQLLLPVCYKYKRFFLDEPLYHYVVYSNSLSRIGPNIEKRVEYRKNIDEALVETLKRMDIPKSELERCLSAVRENQIYANMIIAIRMGERSYARNAYQQMANHSLKTMIIYYGLSNPFGAALVRLLRSIKFHYVSFRVKGAAD